MFTSRSILFAGVSAPALLVTLSLATTASANDFSDSISSEAAGIKSSWLQDPLIIEAITAQNAKNADLAQSDIDKLDKTWRAQTAQSSRPLISETLAKPLSNFLLEKVGASEGLYTEVFVMDDKGLNVGQSDVTSDYWQGDEAKWQKTFLAGPDAMHISEVEEDESTQTFQSQLSLPIVDPASGKAIGAITIGINVELL